MDYLCSAGQGAIDKGRCLLIRWGKADIARIHLPALVAAF